MFSCYGWADVRESIGAMSSTRIDAPVVQNRQQSQPFLGSGAFRAAGRKEQTVELEALENIQVRDSRVPMPQRRISS